ncbi:MAG: hypothetical protein OCD01_16450 [Fibrobacterales bacterium]
MMKLSAECLLFVSKYCFLTLRVCLWQMLIALAFRGPAFWAPKRSGRVQFGCMCEQQISSATSTRPPGNYIKKRKRKKKKASATHIPHYNYGLANIFIGQWLILA